MDLYVIRLEEVNWGALLVAITMAIHGIGMFSILQLTDWIKERFVGHDNAEAAARRIG